MAPTTTSTCSLAKPSAIRDSVFGLRQPGLPPGESNPYAHPQSLGKKRRKTVEKQATRKFGREYLKPNNTMPARNRIVPRPAVECSLNQPPLRNTAMSLRKGLSLVEVLTAIFITGLGIISILTLFPLGAMRMAQAFRDERSALAAYNAEQFFRSYWKKHVVEAAPLDPFIWALDQPAAGMPPCLPHEPSYPVVVDPMGFLARGLPNQNWFGDPPTPTRIPRRNLQVVSTNPTAALSLCLSLCSLRDGITADDNGNPTPEREFRYNFLWVVQRPRNADRFHANLTIVVFDRRAPMYVPPRSEQVFHNVTFNPGQTSLLLEHIPGVSPNQLEIRSGDWVMDGTIYDPSSGIAVDRPGLRHAYFYRVTAMTETTTGTLLEIQPPLRTPADGNLASYRGTLILLRGVSGVFVRHPLTGD